MNSLQATIKHHIKYLSGLNETTPLYLFVFLYILLAGCQSATQSEVQPATMLPTAIQTVAPVETPQTIAAATIPIASVTPTQQMTRPTPDPDKEGEPESVTLELATPSPVSFEEDGMFLYGATINDEDHIYALQPGGSSRFITKGIMLYGQAISPDGTKIVVDANPLSQQPSLPENVFIFDVETGEISPFNFLGVPPFKVFWSDDGSSILYLARHDEASPDQLVVYDVVSGENRVLVEMEKILFTSGWAVDGQTVAYVADVGGQYDLFTINSETLEQQQLTDDPDIETMVLWSPSSLQLLVGVKPNSESPFEMCHGASRIYILSKQKAVIGNYSLMSFSPRNRFPGLLMASKSRFGMKVCFASKIWKP
ncbi:MAG: hypothetical protein IPM39_16680 [Chloroflexi bacterium]|nr:hypothetical protein [Chloroflexota bacterium]